MKRVSALICLMIMAVSILAPSCFAAKETANTQKGANFKIEKTTPENNAKNVSVENLSVKIYFDTEMLPKDKASREANAKGVSLEELPITPADVAEVEKLIASGKLNDKLAKQTVEGVLKGEGTPDEVVKKHDYKIVEDNGAIEAAVDAAFEANPDVVEKLKSGNMKPMGVIIGAVMKATRGQADAKAVTKVVMGKIKG